MRPIAAIAPEMLSPRDLMREWRLLKDLTACALDRRHGRLPRGQASVLVIPGFGAGDWATGVLRRRLATLGHHVYGWGLGVNRGRVEADVARLLPRIDAIGQQRPDAPLVIVGWSLGGVIARQLARQRPEAIADLIALGAPLVGGPKYTFTAWWYARKGMDLDMVERKVTAYETAHPLPCPMLSIFTPHDGMVHPGASFDLHHPGVVHREVDASHLGLVAAPEVLQVIAERLAHRAPAA